MSSYILLSIGFIMGNQDYMNYYINNNDISEETYPLINMRDMQY